MNGLYKYSHPVYDGRGRRTYTPYAMRVEVVTEKGNRYQVKYLGQHANGAAIGSLHWVRKDKVKLDSPVQEAAAPCAKPLPENYRLPYND